MFYFQDVWENMIYVLFCPRNSDKGVSSRLSPAKSLISAFTSVYQLLSISDTVLENISKINKMP